MSVTLTITPRILAHPWYRKWECGELPVESLRHYAAEYYWQVAHFPRYLSRIHSQLLDLASRGVILRNLQDQENEKAPHPELWLDFAQALGADRAAVASGTPGVAARALVEQFLALTESSPEEGLGALLAYESQVPQVAQFKGKALSTHYLPADRVEQGTRFFAVHEKADEWHTAELDALVAKLPAEKKARAQASANRAAQALWRFLDAMPH